MFITKNCCDSIALALSLLIFDRFIIKTTIKKASRAYSNIKHIGLVDADLLCNGTRHPNLALLKIAGYLKENGYIHYEVSNFCMPGYESKHNKTYWKTNRKGKEIIVGHSPDTSIFMRIMAFMLKIIPEKLI